MSNYIKLFFLVAIVGVSLLCVVGVTNTQDSVSNSIGVPNDTSANVQQSVEQTEQAVTDLAVGVVEAAAEVVVEISETTNEAVEAIDAETARLAVCAHQCNNNVECVASCTK